MGSGVKRTRDWINLIMGELHERAIEEKGYTFPFIMVLVTADGYMYALQFAEPDKSPVQLCQYFPAEDSEIRFPLIFFLSCKGKEPIAAKLDPGSSEPRWVN
jgi:hypothetical protein